jgi:hypothetical protein
MVSTPSSSKALFSNIFFRKASTFSPGLLLAC